MPLEKPFRKSQRLGPCKEQFLSLLNLFLSLRVELVHSIEKRATNSSRARSCVQRTAHNCVFARIELQDGVTSANAAVDCVLDCLKPIDVIADHVSDDCNFLVC